MTSEPAAARFDKSSLIVIGISIGAAVVCGLVCAICHKPIQYWRSHGDPMAFTVDRITPIRTAPEKALSVANWQPSHARCNRQRGGYGDDDGDYLDLGEPSEVW